MEDKNPLVSIIVPCYNHAKYLPDALDSIQSQSYTNWECIIVNDGSSDNTSSVAQKWVDADSRFKVINKMNEGLSEARNSGMTLAKGEYFQFLDADDTLEVNKIDNHIRYLNNNTHDNVITYSASRYFHDNTHAVSIFRDNYFPQVELTVYDSKEDQQRMVFNRNIVVVSAPLYPKKLFTEIGNYSKKLFSLEDWDINIRAILNGYKFHYLSYQPLTLTLIRITGNSMMTNTDNLRTAMTELKKRHINTDTLGIWNLKVKQQPKKSSLLLYNLLPPIVYKFLKKMI